MKSGLIALSLILSALSTQLHAAKPADGDVVVTIRPLHSLAASVLGELAEPTLLLDKVE